MQHLAADWVPGNEVYYQPGLGFVGILTSVLSAGSQIYFSAQEMRLKKKMQEAAEKAQKAEAAAEQRRALQQMELEKMRFAAATQRMPLQAAVVQCPQLKGIEMGTKGLGQYIVADIAPSPLNAPGYENKFQRKTFGSAARDVFGRTWGLGDVGQSDEDLPP